MIAVVLLQVQWACWVWRQHPGGTRLRRHLAAGAVDGGQPAAPVLTIAAVQRHLFPNGGAGPGADDINATRYLQGVLSEHGMDQDD